MSGVHPLGMAEFFALEAGEYLERLDALLGPDGTPAMDEFVRLARALRGSALMASQPAIGRAASGLESLARAVREGRRDWDTAVRAAAIRAVDDLKVFVRRAPQWSDADSRTAETLTSQLEQIAGRPSAQVRAVEALGLDAGARAFIAREGAAIASALDRAAHATRTNPRASEPLAAVQRALEPLRGLAALSDLPPLGDLLDGVEQVTGLPPRPGAPAADFFAAAASAIAQAAREVAERGRPNPDAPPFRAFAGLLVRMLDTDADVVPIEALFHSDAGPHVVRRGAAPSGRRRWAGSSW
jgi:chemotaxis protein histidine kinase CheA